MLRYARIIYFDWNIDTLAQWNWGRNLPKKFNGLFWAASSLSSARYLILMIPEFSLQLSNLRMEVDEEISSRPQCIVRRRARASSWMIQTRFQYNLARNYNNAASLKWWVVGEANLDSIELLSRLTKSIAKLESSPSPSDHSLRSSIYKPIHNGCWLRSVLSCWLIQTGSTLENERQLLGSFTTGSHCPA